MQHRHIGHLVRLRDICLTSLLIVLAFAVTACGPGSQDAGTAP
jgi:hypothetical protein